jgi:hypothetical protein
MEVHIEGAVGRAIKGTHVSNHGQDGRVDVILLSGWQKGHVEDR